MDGDGTPDIAVASPNFDAGGLEDRFEGLVQVFSGADGSEILRFTGSEDGSIGSRLASAVASVGDLNGDGRADLLVGEVPQGAVFGVGRGRVVALGLVPSSEALSNLVRLIDRLALPRGLSTSLQALLQAAKKTLEVGKSSVALEQLRVFLHILAIHLQVGQVSAADASLLVQSVEVIQGALEGH